jgi:hypothetical protein
MQRIHEEQNGHLPVRHCEFKSDPKSDVDQEIETMDQRLNYRQFAIELERFYNSVCGRVSDSRSISEFQNAVPIRHVCRSGSGSAAGSSAVH